jgi:hypothetical protein
MFCRNSHAAAARCFIWRRRKYSKMMYCRICNDPMSVIS